MHEKIGIFVNPTAQERYKRTAFDLFAKFPNSMLHELAFPLEAIPDEVETTIVVGGDGTVKAVMEELLKRENPGALLILPAGAQNGLYNALADERSIVTLQLLQSNDIAHIPYYTPGSIHGDLFNHLADLTKAGLSQLEHVEAMRRYTPGKLRPYLAVAVGSVTLKIGDDYPSFEIKTLVPTPFIGALKVLPQQRLYGEDITLISLDAKNKKEGAVKMGLLFFYMLMRKTPPRNIAEVQTQKSFSVGVYSHQEFNIDGERRKVPNSGTIFVARHHRSLQVAALSLRS